MRRRLSPLITLVSCAAPAAALLVHAPPAAAADAASPAPEPFAWGDFTWLNGGSRLSESVLSAGPFTGQVDLDLNYNFSFHRPVDDSVVGSTALARHNEVQLAFLGVGGDLRWRSARGRIYLQHGTRSQTVPRNDASVNRGPFALAEVYRYVSEAYAGVHLPVLCGLNVDVGLFNSYIGLFSYDNFENWAYQPSFTSDNTPWFFNGLRAQLFPTTTLKTELWLVNGWQSYGKFNTLPAVGYQIAWRPTQDLALVATGYAGTDTPGAPARVRLHGDHSVLWRYYRRPTAVLGGAALSATFDLGAELGDGVSPTGSGDTQAQHFLSGMLYHRTWWLGGTLAWTVGGGIIHNPGRYLALAPPGAGAAAFPIAPGLPFDAWDVSTTVDFMPSAHSTWRIELVHRRSAQPYFAGPGGITSPTGLVTDPPGATWSPDLVPHETRLVLALLVRF